ncbi:MAG: hypothetical protein R3F56_00995 [Planctomycetota bacterium]
MLRCSVAAQDPEPADPPEAGAADRAADPAIAHKTKPWLRGQIDTRYRGRWASGADDHDLYGTLTLDLGDEDSDRVTGHFMGRLAWDVDGAESTDSPFYSLADTWNDDVVGYVYDAYADVHRVGGLSMLRIGRQPIYDTPEFAFFDGVRIESSELGKAKVKVGAYGGLSTHLYEWSHSDDWTLGAFVQLRPWTGGRVRFDWMHLEDQRRLEEHEDDLLGAALWQRIGEHLRLEAQYSRIEDRDRDVRGLLGYTLPEHDLNATITYYQLLRTQRDLVLELDPFYSSLLEYRPFWQLGASVAKGLAEHVRLDVGGDVRRVRDDADIGTFNRDYERYHATLSLDELLAQGLTVSATGDLWRSGGQDVSSFGFDVTQEIAKKWRASAGTYYALYKYDLFFNRESDHVRTYFARVRYKASDDLLGSFAYEFEDNDLDQFHSLRLDVTWRF